MCACVHVFVRIHLFVCVWMHIFPIGVNIDMTAPVTVKIEEKKKMWASSVFTLSFLLPSDYQMTPPQPTDESVRPNLK